MILEGNEKEEPTSFSVAVYGKKSTDTKIHNSDDVGPCQVVNQSVHQCEAFRQIKARR